MELKTRSAASAGLKNVQRIDVEKILSPFTERQLRLIFRNLGALELTSGCSIGCDFCGVEAKKGVSKRIEWPDIVQLVEKFGALMKESNAFLYYATDPLDWSDGKHDYRDVSALFEDKAGYRPMVSTAVPRGKEELMLQLLLAGKLERVSVSYMNYGRLGTFFEEKFPLLVDHEFKVEIHEDGKREVSFTSEPNTHGKDAWIRLLLELATSRQDQQSVLFSGGTSRIRPLGSKNLDNIDPLGIACFHGTFFGDNGIWNKEIMLASREHPQGRIMRPLDPKNLEVYHHWYYPFYQFLNMLPKKEITDAFTRHQPIYELIRPVLTEELGYEKGIKAKQILLSSYAVVIAFIEGYEFNLRRLLDEPPASALTGAQMVITMLEKSRAEETSTLDLTQPYDLRLSKARERYAEAERKMQLSLRG